MEIKTVGVLGLGTMGGGIAQVGMEFTIAGVGDHDRAVCRRAGGDEEIRARAGGGADERGRSETEGDELVLHEHPHCQTKMSQVQGVRCVNRSRMS